MCVSLEASLLAGTAVGGSGVLALRIAPRQERLLAATPILFGIQQWIEALVWWSIADPAQAGVARIAALSFAAFAFVLWPLWTPCVVRAAETGSNAQRRHTGFLLLGGIVSLFGAWMLLRHGLDVRAHEGHIAYQIPGVPRGGRAPYLLLYATAILGPLLASRRMNLRILGGAVASALVVSLTYFARWLASFWCLLAACSSLTILLLLLAESAVRHAPHPAVSIVPRILGRTRRTW